MTIKMPRNLMTAISVVAFAVLLHGCGGGGGGSPATMAPDETTPPAGPMIAGATVPSGTMITLPTGVDIQDGTLRADMDETITVEDIGTFTCVSADGCSVDLTDGVITTSGDITVVSLDVTDATILAQLVAVLPPPPVELNELETAQAAAAAAATAAMTAAGNAMAAATAAVDAGENLATEQTGETSSGLATKASDQAALAHAAYTAAKTASDAAAAATDVTAAVRAQVNAENALADATDAETMAGNYSQMAMDAAGKELMIEGTVKTVGGTSLDATAGSSVVTTDGTTEETGLIESKNPEAMMVGEVEGVLFVQDNVGTADEDETVAHVQAVAARTFDIGKVVDSSDDLARLMIVTQYAGTKSVKVYATETGNDLSGPLGSDGRIQTAGTGDEDATNDGFATLKSVGTYYLAGGAEDNNGLANGDVVGAMSEGKEVFSFVDDNASPTDDSDDTRGYVVLGSTTVAGTVTTVTYERVDITVAGQPDEDNADTVMQVTAGIPEATDYKHIHFGVWAALGEAEKDGTQKIADRGIGFVQSIGDGLTGADMPNNGDATYNGNWVAAVQVADDDGNGAISLTNGVASMKADFGKGDITATLTNLATLSGKISENTFLGEKATVGTNTLGLTAEADFTGSFSGGFYGAKAAEAGGVFDFVSEDNEAGAFRGAFGGKR